jgi:hypothetical protein
VKSAVWLAAFGLTLAAFSCDPELSLEEALNNKRCTSEKPPRCADGYVCDQGICVRPENVHSPDDVRSPEAGPPGVDPPPRDAGGAGGSEAIRDGRDTMSSDVPDAADAAPDCTIQLFRDRDGDGYGSDAPGDVTFKCPPLEGYVSQGGDCFDAALDAGDLAAKVHPGQFEFFAEGYPRPGQPGEVSFDYDCSRSEEADPNNEYRVAPGDCSGAAPPNVCGSFVGMVPSSTDRSGAGINPLCGSTTLRTCDAMNAQCVPQLVEVPEGQFRCH